MFDDRRRVLLHRHGRRRRWRWRHRQRRQLVYDSGGRVPGRLLRLWYSPLLISARGTPLRFSTARFAAVLPAIIAIHAWGISAETAPPSAPVSMRFAQAITTPVEGTITFREVMGPPASVVLNCCSPATMAVALPTKTAWEVVPALHGAWAAHQFVVIPNATPVTVSLPIWPVSTLSGRFEKPPDVSLPSKFTITLRDPPGRVSGIAFSDAFECPIASDGRWSCDVPAATVDLLLTIGGFVPMQKWELSLGAGQRRDLGILKLRKGASLSGWIRLAQGKLTDGTGKAAIVPLAASGGSAAIAGRLARPIAETAIQKNGYFQMVGVPPGQYAIRVTYPGFGVETLLPVQIFGGRETTIRKPIVLQRPVTVKVSLVPAHDWRGMPWPLVLQHASAISGAYDTRPVYTGPAGDGSVVMGDLSSGRYMVTVYDSAGDPLKNQEFDAAGGTEADQVVHLDLISIEGSVTMGDAPLAATLWFGGRHGAERVVMRSNAKGEFRGLIPHDGKWRVSIETDQQDTFQTVADVHVRDGAARVSLKIPSNEVTGIVIDEHGDPVDGAAVTLISTQNSAIRPSGKDGTLDRKSTRLN